MLAKGVVALERCLCAALRAALCVLLLGGLLLALSFAAGRHRVEARRACRVLVWEEIVYVYIRKARFIPQQVFPARHDLVPRETRPSWLSHTARLARAASRGHTPINIIEP